MAKNLVYSWVGVVAQMVAGFVLPRATDAHFGRAGLGVWDFAWSIVGNFGLAQLGINTAVARYVARYRGQGDVPGLRRMASSVLAVQIGVAAVLVGVTLVLAWNVPWLIREDLGALASEARWVLLFLGLTLVVQIATNTFANVIIGCHRWDVHYTIELYYPVVVGGMLVVQALGYSLSAMALVYLAVVILAEVCRIVVAYRICPELSVRPRYATWSETKEMLSFGGKQFIGALASRMTYQVNNAQIGRALGPAELALYARPMSLVRIIGDFVSKLANMLTPLASEMDASGRPNEIRSLVMRTTEASAYIALPGLVFLAIMGDAVLRVWMGADYASQGLLVAVLAVGHLGAFTHRPMITVLIGVDAQKHYVLGSLLMAAATVIACGWLLQTPRAGLIVAALAVVVPLTLLGAIYLPVYGCRVLGISVRDYFTGSWKKPLLIMLPFAALLAALRLLLPPLAALAAGIVGGGGLLAVLYWRRVLPEHLRDSARSRVRRVWSRFTSR